MAPQESTTFRSSETEFANFYRVYRGSYRKPAFSTGRLFTPTGSLPTPIGSLSTPTGSPPTPKGSDTVQGRVNGGVDGREVMGPEHEDEAMKKCGSWLMVERKQRNESR